MAWKTKETALQQLNAEKELTKQLKLENLDLHLKLGHVIATFTKDEANVLVKLIDGLADNAEEKDWVEEAKTLRNLANKLLVK